MIRIKADWLRRWNRLGDKRYLARLLDVDPATITRYFSGKRSVASSFIEKATKTHKKKFGDIFEII